MSNAAPKSETRGGYGRGGPGGHNNRGGGPGGPDGPGMYQQRGGYNPGPNQGNWSSQGPRGNIDMPNLQALGKSLSHIFL